MRNLHEWNLSYKQAVELQKALASKVRFTPLKKFPKLMAGTDCAFTADKKKILCCAVVLEYPNLNVIEIVHSIQKTTFPYIPGLLSFREAPACLAAVEKLKHKPDLFMVDGQGIAHPRRLGLAAHLGLFFDKPTIGCAKSRLIGTYEPPATAKGKYSELYDDDEVIGAVVRTKNNCKPVFVSVGNRCDLNNAINCVLDCTTKFRIPEPTRLADIEVAKIKKSL